MADTAFAGAGRAPGLELWRVENRGIVKQKQVSIPRIPLSVAF
jgi:hypothetical protein